MGPSDIATDGCAPWQSRETLYTGRPLARCPPKAGPFPATPGPNPAG